MLNKQTSLSTIQKRLFPCQPAIQQSVNISVILIMFFEEFRNGRLPLHPALVPVPEILFVARHHLSDLIKTEILSLE